MEKITSSLFLQDLELDIHLGWSDAERQQKQKVAVDITIRFPEASAACNTDDLSDTNCYDLLTKSIDLYLKNREFRLIEHLGKSLFDHIKQYFAMPIFLSVCIKKSPSSYITNLKGGVWFHYGDLQDTI